MSSRVCEDCSRPGSLNACSICQKSICSGCFDLHIEAHTFKTIVDQAGRKIKVPIQFCNFDTAPAVGISADLDYVCETHSKDKEVFSLEQAQFLFDHQEQGVEILRRAKKIDEVCSFLREVPKAVEKRLLESVERDCELVTAALASAKADIVTEIQSQIAEFRAHLSSLLEHLEAQKMQPEVAISTTLEEMVFNLPLEEIMENLRAEKWFLNSCNREAVRNIQKNYFCLRRSETLLYKPPVECAWKDDYYCLPGRPFKVFSLLEEKVCPCNTQVSYTNELVWTILPDGCFFFCGDMTSTACRLLDSNYSEYKRVGEMLSVRENPGIIHFEGAIYIFGGKHVNLPIKSIEAFNLLACVSVALPVEMQAPRSHFCPCVWNRQIFLGSDFCTGVLEVFDPIGNVCHIVNAELPSLPSVLIRLNDEEIVVLVRDIIRYFPNEMRAAKVSKEEFGFYCPGGVVSCKGKAYFALVQSKFWRVCCLEDNYKVREITKVFD